MLIFLLFFSPFSLLCCSHCDSRSQLTWQLFGEKNLLHYIRGSRMSLVDSDRKQFSVVVIHRSAIVFFFFFSLLGCVVTQRLSSDRLSQMSVNETQTECGVMAASLLQCCTWTQMRACGEKRRRSAFHKALVSCEAAPRHNHKSSRWKLGVRHIPT